MNNATPTDLRDIIVRGYDRNTQLQKTTSSECLLRLPFQDGMGDPVEVSLCLDGETVRGLPMKHLFGKIALPPLTIAVILLTAAALLACGPVASEEQPGTQPGQQDSEGTPAPTEEEGPKYPKLDATFQQLVQQFEDGELTETQAAAQAPDHFDSNVMVIVDLSANLEAVDAWLSRQDLKYTPRLADPNYTPLYINAWVPVSLLGALSQQDGVIIVSSTYKYRYINGDASKGRPPISAPKPTSKYPAIDGNLQQDVVKFEEGQRAEGQARGQAGDDVEDSVVAVRVELMPANTEAVAAWLRSNGVSSYAGGGLIEADVPLSLLSALAQQDGVYKITPIRPPMVDSPSR